MTANSASVTTAQGPATPTLPAKTVKLDCKSPRHGFSDCEKKQICAKVDAVNKQAQAGKLKRPKRSRREKKIARRRGNGAATKYKRRLGMKLKGVGNYGRTLSKPATPESLKKNFMHECAHQEWMDPPSNANPDMPGLSADHVHEIQLGGSATSSRNLKMMSSNANEWVGSKLRKYKPEKGYNSVSGDCCPA
ncbi:MAG: hypothetical protein AAGF11_29625 [Myxococcota bacterium]